MQIIWKYNKIWFNKHIKHILYPHNNGFMKKYMKFNHVLT